VSSYTKFFDAFGYVTLRHLYDRGAVASLQRAYDAVVTSVHGKGVEEFSANLPPIVAGVETSQELLDFVRGLGILPIVDELLGPGAVFITSDLSTFKSGSQFHRDAIGDYVLLKVALYLQDSTDQDGGFFCFIPGSQHFGDRYSDLCEEGFLWPRSAGYAENALTGEFDCIKKIVQNGIPAARIDLAAGDAVLFNPALIHAVPATNRTRRLIALTFFEGETSFNSRPRPPGEFSGLTHRETLTALRLAFSLFDIRNGRIPHLNYHEKLKTFDISWLKPYLREFTAEEYDEINARLFKNSYETAYRFLTKSSPA
jgi:ectoine hydroxylase-related dioxygenase (phytanoyl-CoA dioxygenase family)